ncbi:MAG: monomethylamine:corrinoid methyltransferase [Candidatus Heimdallarchaeota archaeon]
MYAIRAGRPDMGCHNVVACGEKTAAIIAANRPEFGVRKTDGFLVAALGEMKIDYERFNKAAHLLETGNVIGGLYGPIMGGYAGGPEGTAIATIAHHFLGLLIFKAEWHCYFPFHVLQNCSTMRELLWVYSIVGQALSRNTHLLHSAAPCMAAGPCTKMVVDELAASSTIATVSGAHLDIVAVARNKYPGHCTGMEARIAADFGHIVAEAGMKREDANEIVQKLLVKYEDNIPNAPIGKHFSECYDITTVTPSKEYLELYDKKKKELEDMGFDFSLFSH